MGGLLCSKWKNNHIRNGKVTQMFLIPILVLRKFRQREKEREKTFPGFYNKLNSRLLSPLGILSKM